MYYIFWTIFSDKADLLTFGTLIYSDYYLNLIYINYVDSGCVVSDMLLMSIIRYIV